MITTTAALLALQSSVVLAYKPAIQNAYYYVTTVKEYPAASFKMDFNDTLYLKNIVTGAKFLYSDPSMFAPAPFPFTSSVSIFFLRELVNHHLHVHFAKSKKNCLIVQHFYLLISLIWSISPSGWTSAFRDPLFCFSCLLSFVCTRRTPVYLHFS